MTPSTRVARPDFRAADLITGIPFFACHAVALAAVIWTRVTWADIALVAGLYYVRMWALTTGYHRYFSHRSFKTGRVFQFVLALVGTTCTQKGVLWWAANHRQHHKYSDQPDDIHSPKQRGFWWSHCLWIVSSRYNETQFDRIQDFARYPELRWLNRYHLVPSIALATALYLIGGAHMLLWGYFVSTVVLWHGTFTINSLAHVFGKRRYETTDTSKNNFLLALITMGEGWHNNHHHYMSSARQGFYWWELDLSYSILQLLERLGIVWDVRRPPQSVLDAGRGRGTAAAMAVAPSPVIEPTL